MLKVILKLTDKDILDLKEFVDDIRYQKKAAGFVREYDKVYKDVIKAKMINQPYHTT